MNILVCMKQTFDTEEKIVIKDGQVQEDGAEFIINPYCEYAVEEAIRLKELHGGEVTVVTVGSSRAEGALRTALAMGVDKAALIDDEGRALDEFSVSKILAAFAKKESYDLVLTGYMSVDQGAAQLGPRLAEELGIPHVITVTKLTIDGNTATIEKDSEGDTETIEAALPVLITTQQGLNEPRYPSLPNIMKAKKKPLDRLGLGDIGLHAEELNAKTVVFGQFLPPAKQGGRKLAGEFKEQASELVRLLREEAKII